MNNKKIRLATEKDSEPILNIYTPYIAHTAITFEYEIPTIKEFKERMANIQKNFPWLVCEIDNRIVGYAYASRFKEREAYNWSAELSIYIDRDYHRKNIGKALYTVLLELLKLQGYYNAYACVTVPNIKSESLHEAFGFKEVGVYHKVGYKLGSWHDVKWYELNLKEYSQAPLKPQSINELIDTNGFKAIIEKGEQLIKAD